MRFSMLLGFSLLVLCASPSSAQYSPKVGELHDDFTLPQIGDRSPVSLSQFRGQRVLLIHFASW